MNRRRCGVVRVAAGTALTMLAFSVVPVSNPRAVADPVTAATSIEAGKRLARSRHVFVVGDSLTVGAAPHIRNSLRGHVAGVSVDAAISRFTPTGVRLLGSRPARRAEIWVVALGTNDSPDPGRMRTAVREVLGRARGRKVVWVNIVRPGGYERVNQELARLDVRYANLTVLDWWGAIRRHRSWLTGDGVHLTAAGYRARGRMIANAARNLARQP